MQPSVRYKDGLYKVVSLWWGDDGEVRHVSFKYAEGQELITVFPGELKFEEAIIWEESE